MPPDTSVLVGCHAPFCRRHCPRCLHRMNGYRSVSLTSTKSAACRLKLIRSSQLALAVYKAISPRRLGCNQNVGPRQYCRRCPPTAYPLPGLCMAVSAPVTSLEFGRRAYKGGAEPTGSRFAARLGKDWARLSPLCSTSRPRTGVQYQPLERCATYCWTGKSGQMGNTSGACVSQSGCSSSVHPPGLLFGLPISFH